MMSTTASSPSIRKAVRPFVEDDDYADAEKNFNTKSPKFWLIIISVYFSIFLVALDRMIIATAIPSITNEFHSIQDIGWYGSAYMLTAATFEPTFGRVYQLYSTKWVFLISLIIFEAGSALCGAAPTSSAFIVGRAISGVGAAGIFVGGIMIIVPLVPLRKRPVFTAFFGIAFAISSVIGPLIGGTFTDNTLVNPLSRLRDALVLTRSRHLTWRWSFYINLPIGGFTIIMIFLFLHLESPPQEKTTVFAKFLRLDPLGLLFFVPSIVCLILALQWGGTSYAWSSPRVIGLLVTFAITMVIFLIIEYLTPSTAMVPFRILLDRSVGSSMLYMILISGAMMSIIYYLTIFFQAAQSQSALSSGLRSIPLVLSMTVFGIIAAIVTEKTTYYVPAMLFCPVLCATGAGLLSTLTPSATASQWIGYQVLFGFGIGSGFQTSTLVPQTVLDKEDVPLGMALMFFSQQLGGAVFLAVAQNIFSIKLVDGLSDIAGLDAQVIINTGATALRSVVPEADVNVVVKEYSYALTKVFIMAAALCTVMILPALAVEWKSIKQEKKGDTEIAKESTSKVGNLADGTKKEIKDTTTESSAEVDCQLKE